MTDSVQLSPCIKNYPKELGGLNQQRFYSIMILCVINSGRAQLGNSLPDGVDWVHSVMFSE